MRLLTGPDAGDRDAEGTVVARTKTEKTTTGDGGIRLWAGTAGDPFYIEPTVVQAVSTAVAEGRALDLTGFDPRQAENKFADANVQAIVIEVPDRFFRGLTIGCWGAIAVPTDAGDGWRQTDRAGIPLVSTLFGLTDTDDYAATQPAVDDATWGHLLQDKTAKVVEANSPGGDVDEYALRVRGMLLPEILPYRIGTDAHFVHGRRNGRSLRENVAEDMYQLVLRRRVETGLTSDTATGSFRDDFPYLSQPA